MTKRCLLSAFGIALCLLVFMVKSSSAQQTVTAKVTGVHAFAFWTDASTPDDVVGYVEVFATGMPAQPYFLFYSLFDYTALSFVALGSGNLPAASVQAIGESVRSGKITVSVNVNTCLLDASVFSTIYGSCGTINVNCKQVPGFFETMNGSRVLQSGSFTEKIQGTEDVAFATTQGSVIGSSLSPANSSGEVTVDHQTIVTLNLPH